MSKNSIVRLKKKLIEDITNIERNKIIKQENLRSKIYFETPYDKKMRELAEDIERQQMRDITEFVKKLEKENEKILQEMLENMKKRK